MKQSQIDQLLMSSQDQQIMNKKKKLSKKQVVEQYDNYEDEFFQSQNQKDINKKNSKKNISQKELVNNKGRAKSGSLKSYEDPKAKGKEKDKPQQKEPSEVDEYLNSEDFQSQVSQGDQKFNPIVKPKALPVKPQSQPQEQNYQVQDDFEQQIIDTSRKSIKRKISNASKAQSQDLVKSEYTQSRAEAQQEIQEIRDNVDQEIQTVKSSKIRSQLLNDDDLSQAQSEYIESTRINQQQFKKKSQSKDQSKDISKNDANKGPTKAIINSVNKPNMKKKQEASQAVVTKKGSIASKKKIAENDKKSTGQTKKNAMQLNPAKANKRQKSKQPQRQPKSSKNISNSNIPSKSGTNKKLGPQVEEQISQRQSRITQIQSQKKALKQKRQAKKKQQEQKAKQEYQQRRRKNQAGQYMKRATLQGEVSKEQRSANIAKIQAQKKELQQKRQAKKRRQQQKAREQYQEMKKKHQQIQQGKRKILQQQKKKQKLNATLPKDGNKRAALEKQQLNLTESKVKELAEEKAKKKEAKGRMEVTEQMRKKRKEEEEQVKAKLQQENKEKLRRLQKQKQSYMDKAGGIKKEYEKKHELAIKEKKQNYNNKQKQKINQKKQADTPQIRKIKQQILQLKEKAKQKHLSISSLDDIIKDLKKEKKYKEITNINQGEQYDTKINGGRGAGNINRGGVDLFGIGSDNYIDSDLTPVQKFVRLFDQCHNTAQIFALIDEDKDEFVSLHELKTKVTDILINKQMELDQSRSYSQDTQEHNAQIRFNIQENSGVESLIQEVFAILDKNSDGNVTKEEFSFIIQSEIKKAKQYRRLTNNIGITNPIDIQASILDMKQKIKYMNKKCIQEVSNNRLEQLQEKYRKYLSKHEQYEKRYIYGKSSTKDKKKLKIDKQKAQLQEDLNNDKYYFLTQQVTKLRAQKLNEQRMLQKIRVKQQENIKEKNIQLTKKVEENIKLNQQIYKVSQMIEQYQLRFLSKEKIQQNRYRYISKKQQKKQIYEQAIQRGKQYETKIINPNQIAKQIKFGTYANQVKYMAAILMIQRNFRKRKAIREKETMMVRGNSSKIE